jgi:glutaredoxin-like protein NrdH
MTITVYTQPDCVQCDRTKKWLDDPKRGNMEGQYDIVDLSQDPQALEAVKALGYMSAPVVIVNDNGDTKDEKHWYGFRPDMLTQFCKNIPLEEAA